MPATVSIILAALFPFQVAAQTAQVESFSPRGEVQNVRQVRARFSVPIVAFGSAATEPFEIECTAGGSGRWIDTRNWVYDFEQDLQAGVACSFAIKENLKAFDGRQVVGERTFSFTTGGPSIVRSWPYEGNESIDEEQVFILELNGPALPESVREHAGFAIEDNAERVGVRVLTSEERRSVLDTQYRFRGRDPENVVLVQSLLKFPVGKAVRLLWGRGIESHSGVKRTSEQLLVFRTREAFTANLHCPRENARSNCIPISDIKLSFSAPVSWEQVRPIVLTEDGGRVWPAARFPYDAEQEMIRGVRFEGPFPPESIFSLNLPAEIRDDAGRPLENAARFPLQVRTAAHPPLAKFSGRFGIIEANAEPLLPVTMRNLEPQVAGRISTPLSPSVIPGRLLRFGAGNAQAVFGWLGKLIEPEHQARESSIFAPNDDTEAIRVPKPNGAKAFEVVGIPMPRPGFYVVELESERLGRSLLQKDQPLYVRTGALVTNMAVHFKRGRESSLAWVTTLDAGEPVADARVSLWDCAGNVHWTGRTDASGIVRIPEFDSRISRCGWQRYRRGVLVVAEKAEDLSFTHTSWNEGIEPWRFRLPYATIGDPIRVHTIFGRTLVRAGETIHMKHVMRRPTMQGFEHVKAERAPSGLLIRHGGSGQEYQFGLKWREDGTALFDWIIPRQAKLGQYEVYAIEKLGKRTGRQRLSGSFRVEEFRIPLMKAVVRSPGESLIAPSEVSLDLSIRYLSGGAAGGLPARFRYRFAPMTPPPASGFDGFTFANGPTPGTRAQSVRVEPGVPEPKELRSLELVMDTGGGSKVRIDDVPLPLGRPTEVQTELEFRDPNGEVQTVSQRVPLWPSAKLVGLKPDSWTAGADDLKFQVAVTEIDGTPSAGSEVRVDLYQRKTYSHRKRLVGGYYAYDHRSEVTRIETVCAGVTDGRGLLFCEGASPVSGNVILEAFVQDEAARASYAHRSLWVAGDADWWFEATDHDRIDLIPGQPRYEPGETARFQVRMPFRRATALVTVEREGILESHVTSISGKNPVVEIPVRDNHAPNVFVSVLVVRGRRSEVQPTALIDLGRPTYRLGISEIRVGWERHELEVEVTPERSNYKVRERAAVRIAVSSKKGHLPSGSHVVVAAVDEGLLELKPNESWDLLRSMMGRRSYEVQTSTAQGQVVGKRHFGLKGQPQGGGGGTQRTRELFDTLLFWEADVALDANGQAELDIPLNDSLTQFRIVAVAHAGDELFGTGSATVRTTQDLMVLSGIPPVVREGDRFKAEFTVRNATDRRMKVKVVGSVEGLRKRLKRTVTLDGGQADVVSWEIEVPAGRETLTFSLEARSGDASDRIIVSQKVVTATPARAIQATLLQLDETKRIPVSRPSGAPADRGGIVIDWSASLVGGVDSVREYMRRYPYSCLEQRISRLVGTRDREGFDRLMERLPSYLDADGLTRFFPGISKGSEVLSSYVLSITHEAGWVIPEAPLSRIRQGLVGFVQGRVVRGSSLPTADLTLRKLSALEALSRFGDVKPTLLGTLRIEPDLWPTSSLLDWLNVLQRVTSVPRRTVLTEQALQILRSRIEFRGREMSFSTESLDSCWWLLASVDQNSVRSILTLLGRPGWDEDLPRLVSGAMARMRNGRWGTTPANAWGILATEKYAQAFEATPLTGRSNASLFGQSFGIDWEDPDGVRSATKAWPRRRSSVVVLDHSGAGTPWVSLTARAAVPLKKPVSNGYRISKTWKKVSGEGVWATGDLIRVTLEIDAQADRTWVVLDDPIPAGAVILGSGLGRDSEFGRTGEEASRWFRPTFEERSVQSYRAYYEYLPKGTWMVEYTIRLNQEGRFNLPPSRVEAMYSPDIFGEIPMGPVNVRRGR